MSFFKSTNNRLNFNVGRLYSLVSSMYRNLNFTGLWRYNPLREEYRSLEAELSRINNQFSGEVDKKTRETKEGYDARLQQAISEAKKRISEKAEGQIRGLESRLAKIEYHFGKTKQNLTRIEKLYLKNRSKVTELEEQATAYRSQIKELEEKVKEQTNYMHLYATLVEQEGILKQQRSEQDQIISQLRGDLQAERKTHSILKKSHESQSLAFAAERVNLLNLRGRIEEYKTKLRDLEDDKNFKKLYEAAEQEKKLLERQIRDQENQILLLINKVPSSR